MEDIIAFSLLALIAEIIGTISGFGSSILFVPIATLFFDFQTVLGITAVFHVFSNLSKIVLFKQGIDWKIALKLGIPATIFVLLGALLTAYVSVAQLELGMNLLLVSLSIYLLFQFNRKLSPTNSNLIIGGVSSGFLAGLVGTGGAIRGIVLTAFQLPKTIFVATSALIDLGVDSGRAVIYISEGYFKSQQLIYIPFLILISVVGSWIGKKALTKVSDRLFRYIVLITIIGTSTFQFVKFLMK